MCGVGWLPNAEWFPNAESHFERTGAAGVIDPSSGRSHVEFTTSPMLHRLSGEGSNIRQSSWLASGEKPLALPSVSTSWAGLDPKASAG